MLRQWVGLNASTLLILLFQLCVGPNCVCVFLFYNLTCILETPLRVRLQTYDAAFHQGLRCLLTKKKSCIRHDRSQSGGVDKPLAL